MKTPVSTKISRYSLYLLATSAVYFLSMFLFTAMLIETDMYMLGIPISLLIVLFVRTIIGDRIYRNKLSVHRATTKVHRFLMGISMVLIALSFRFYGSPHYGHGLTISPLLVAAANTGYFIIGCLILQMVRAMFYSPYDEDEDEEDEELKEENIVEQ